MALQAQRPQHQADRNMQPRQCQMVQTRRRQHLDWTDVVSNEQPAETADNGARNTIKIDSDDICTQKGNSDVCHLYVEHINLTNTDVYIKNDTRAIVLHLNLGKTSIAGKT